MIRLRESAAVVTVAYRRVGGRDSGVEIASRTWKQSDPTPCLLCAAQIPCDGPPSPPPSAPCPDVDRRSHAGVSGAASPSWRWWSRPSFSSSLRPVHIASRPISSIDHRSAGRYEGLGPAISATGPRWAGSRAPLAGPAAEERLSPEAQRKARRGERRTRGTEGQALQMGIHSHFCL